jgi:hypothetical protein
MKLGKKLVVGAVLLVLLGLGALTGLHLPTNSTVGAVPAALADGCDSNPPPPGLECPSQPTPTPTPRGDL